MRYLHRRGARIAAALLILGATGCSVGRQSVPAMTDWPESFSRDGQAMTAEGAMPAEHWWTAFSDPQLDLLIAEALTGSPDLAAWWDRLDQARSLARKAGASQWPQLELDGGASRTGRWPDEAPDTYANDFSAQLFASYEIDLWGRVRSSKEAAVNSARASEQDFRAAAISLSANVGATWYELAEAREQLAVLEEQLAANAQILELVTLRFQHGRVGASDVLLQQQLVESTQGDRALAQARIKVLQHQLAVLLGRPPSDAPDISAAQLIELPAPPATGVPAELLQRRPDLQAAWLEVAAANARLAAAVAERYPRLSISAGGQTGAAEVMDLFSDWLGNLAANLMMPLIDGGSRAAEADRQEAVARQALHAYRSTVLTALQDVENALVREERQAEYLASLRRQVELTRVIFDRTKDDYLGGQTDYLRVLQAQTSLHSLQRRLLTAERELIQYRIDLCRALGGRWTLERPAVAGFEEDGRVSS
ncbi:MAG: efflux transporter outer membrane subunit [Candidatus Eisenbacteria sp.]|nr:efflux transporter outer membrane subunit [Candidatus Eisenbacteria bacterium]